MNPEGSREHRIQAFLANAAFNRCFEVFDTYQRLLQNNADNPAKQKEMRGRMKLVFERHPEEADEARREYVREANAIFDEVFSLLENKELTEEKLAEIFANSSIAEKLIASWNPQTGETREKGKAMINEVVEYYAQDEHDNVVDINIVPSSIRGEELWQKVVEGLHLLAEQIDHGSLQNIQTVRAQSWLFSSPSFKEKLLPLLGGATLEDVPEDDGDVVQVQRLALTFHAKTMANFLLTGELPKVQRLQVGREEFLKRFL